MSPADVLRAAEWEEIVPIARSLGMDVVTQCREAARALLDGDGVAFGECIMEYPEAARLLAAMVSTLQAEAISPEDESATASSDSSSG